MFISYKEAILDNEKRVTSIIVAFYSVAVMCKSKARTIFPLHALDFSATFFYSSDIKQTLPCHTALV